MILPILPATLQMPTFVAIYLISNLLSIEAEQFCPITRHNAFENRSLQLVNETRRKYCNAVIG